MLVDSRSCQGTVARVQEYYVGPLAASQKIVPTAYSFGILSACSAQANPILIQY